jgi:hypothetical protein
LATITDFSAKEPSLGYYYQIIYALRELLVSGSQDAIIRIECLDDIEFLDGDSHNLLQTKFHSKGVTNLTDASTDFWKTLRIWIENINANLVDIDKANYFLITTEKVSDTSTLKKFVNNSSRTLFDIQEIIEKLDSVASLSKNETNKKAYEAYLAFDISKKELLFEKIQIIDSSINISELIEEISKELRFSITIEKVHLLTERVLGLWTVKCIRHLMGEVDSLSYKELHSLITDLSEGFKEDNLPDDFNEAIDISDSEAGTYKEKNFVKQLVVLSLKTNSRMVKNAISDFRRAYEQRSKWVRENLININDEQNYNSKLISEWQNLFAILEDKCESVASQDQLTQLSKDFYVDLFVKVYPQVFIKKNFNSAYMVRGSYHILADNKEIGWHIKFNELL